MFFRTALPFGYLIQLLFFVAVAVVALTLLLRGSIRGDKGALWTGGIIGALLTGILVLAVAQPDIDDWNPHPVDPRVLVGRWVDGARTLELRADSTFTLRRGGAVVASGRYEHEAGWPMTLVDARGDALPNPPGAVGLSVVVENGEYRIIDDPGDPDAWDGSLGFRRDPPARVVNARALNAPFTASR